MSFISYKYMGSGEVSTCKSYKSCKAGPYLFPPFISKIRKEHNYAWSHSRDDDLENAIDGIMEVLVH